MIVITEAEIEIELGIRFFFLQKVLSKRKDIYIGINNEEGEWVTAHNRVGDYPIHCLT